MASDKAPRHRIETATTIERLRLTLLRDELRPLQRPARIDFLVLPNVSAAGGARSRWRSNSAASFSVGGPPCLLVEDSTIAQRLVRATRTSPRVRRDSARRRREARAPPGSVPKSLYLMSTRLCRTYRVLIVRPCLPQSDSAYAPRGRAPPGHGPRPCLAVRVIDVCCHATASTTSTRTDRCLLRDQGSHQVSRPPSPQGMRAPDAAPSSGDTVTRLTSKLVTAACHAVAPVGNATHSAADPGLYDGAAAHRIAGASRSTARSRYRVSKTRPSAALPRSNAIPIATPSSVTASCTGVQAELSRESRRLRSRRRLLPNGARPRSFDAEQTLARLSDRKSIGTVHTCRIGVEWNT